MADETKSIRCRGRTERVLDELVLGRKNYFLLERLASGPRERYRAFDPLAGPQGDYRAIHVVGRSPDTEHKLAVLQRLADLRSANVPLLIEHHRRGDKIYLVLAWVPGRSLASHWERIRSGRDAPWSPFHVCRLIRGLAHGLCQLHHQWNVIHGDLKPANLIVAPEGRYLATIDFGSAWLVEKTTNRDAGDGTSGVYSAPEILEGDGGDFRSDQFSLAVVWYELLTGRIPYDGAGGKGGLAAVSEAFSGKLAPPSEHLLHQKQKPPKKLARLIDAAVCRSLAFDPAARFPERRSWLDALDDIHHEFRGRKPRLGRFNAWAARLMARFSSPRPPKSDRD